MSAVETTITQMPGYKAAKAIAQAFPSASFCFFSTYTKEGELKKMPLQRDGAQGVAINVPASALVTSQEVVDGILVPPPSAQFMGVSMNRPIESETGRLIALDIDAKQTAQKRMTAKQLALLANARKKGLLTETSHSCIGAHIFCVGNRELLPNKVACEEPGADVEIFGLGGAKNVLLTDTDLAGELKFATPTGLLAGAGIDIVEARTAKTSTNTPVKAPEPPLQTFSAPTGVLGAGDEWRAVNDSALKNLDAWVPLLFPGAKPYNGGYRVTSKNISRDLEEDIGIMPEGIKDFGVADLGDARGGKRTAIDLVAEHNGGTPLDAAKWLAGRVGVQWPERASKVDVVMGAGDVEPSSSKGREFPHIDDVQVWEPGANVKTPSHLLKAPHPFLQAVTDAIEASAETTDKALNLSGSIALAAVSTARLVRSNKANHPVLLMCSVARTGAGKNAGRNFVNRTMTRATGHTMPSDFTSASSLFSMLRIKPNTTLLLDEFGDKLHAGLHDAAGSHVTKGFSAIKEIFSQCDDVWAPSAYSLIGMTSKQRDDFRANNAPVKKPCMNLVATTTPGQLARAITDAAVEGGLINRFIFINGSGDLVENDDFESNPPDWLVDHVRSLRAGLGVSQGNLSDVLSDFQDDPDHEPSLRQYDFCQNSMDRFNAFKAEIKTLGQNDEFMEDMTRRWREIAMRMALAIHAFCDPHEVTINSDVTAWCIDYVRFHGRKFVRQSLELATPMERYGQRRQAYLRAFRSHPKGITKHDMGKRAPWRDDSANFRNALIEDMLQSGEIICAVGDKPARGPVPVLFVAVAQ